MRQKFNENEIFQLLKQFQHRNNYENFVTHFESSVNLNILDQIKCWNIEKVLKYIHGVSYVDFFCLDD